MRRNLTLRFITAYVLIAIVAQALSSSVWILLQGAGILKFDETVNLWELGRQLLVGMGQATMSMLIPGMDLGSLAGSLISTGVLVAGAFIFTVGPVRQYESLCERAEMLAPGGINSSGDKKNSLAMECRLDAIAARLAAVEGEARVCRSNCQQATMLLQEACVQIEVLLEADALAEGSAEAALVRDVIEKLKKAEAQMDT